MSSWAALRPWLLSAEARAQTEHSLPNLRRRTEAAIMNSAWSGSFFVDSCFIMGASGHYRQARNLLMECPCQSRKGGAISLAIQIRQVARLTVKLPCHPSQKPRWHTVRKRFVCFRCRKAPSHIQKFAHSSCSIRSWAMSVASGSEAGVGKLPVCFFFLDGVPLARVTQSPWPDIWDASQP
jgi:hypothetical protein